ncbi:MAG: hypothetical protein CM1200mP9_00470 [Gammaproteobacteria bacterium]|nr:MAG: hypothetical protein CM1200mP9_00470 [Gammaproteobacteria bacterium]
MSLMRGIGDGKSWILVTRHNLATRSQHRISGLRRDWYRAAIAEMLSLGVTTASDMYYFPDVTAAVAIKLGFRAQIAFPIIELPNLYSNTVDECIHRGIELSDDYRSTTTIHPAFGPHSNPRRAEDAYSSVHVSG